MLPPFARPVATVALVLLATGCGGGAPSATSSEPTSRPATKTAAVTSMSTTTMSTTTTSTTTTSTSSTPVTTTPVTTTTTTAPPFSGAVALVSATDLPSTYRAGCPVAPAALRMLHMSYWGFDDRPHIGTMVVNATVITAVLAVFARLYRERFPIRQMRPVDGFGGQDPASMAADNTSAFNCRDAVASGPSRWSVHAYGEAIDVNPVENPYLQGGHVQPLAGAAFTNRGDARPGMAGPGTLINDAFASVGWLWGGRWTASPDYQHFSKTGG